MSRWLISLFLVFFLEISGTWINPPVAIAKTATEFSQQQVFEGEKIAKKAFRAAARGDFGEREEFGWYKNNLHISCLYFGYYFLVLVNLVTQVI